MKLKKITSIILIAALALNVESGSVAAKTTYDKNQEISWNSIHTDNSSMNDLKTIDKASVFEGKPKKLNTKKQFKGITINESLSKGVNSYSLSKNAKQLAIDLAENQEEPTEEPTVEPTEEPTVEPTEEPTQQTKPNTTADTAYYLSDEYMNVLISDVADTDENWYYFHCPANTKISAVMQSPSTGDYDMYLYSLNDTTLNLVGYSLNTGTAMEQLSYVSNEGYYFLRFVPNNVTANSTLQFEIDQITQFDASEPDDNTYFARAYTDSINVNNTIDNVYDRDWFSFTVTQKSAYTIALLNVPSGNQYFVNLYDNNFTSLGGMLSSGNQTAGVTLEAGTYYFYVASYNGKFSTSDAYNLRVQKRNSTSSKVLVSKTGKLVEITNNAVYINGNAVNLSWETSYFTPDTYWIHYAQKVHSTADSKIAASSCSNGKLQGSSTSGATAYNDCLEVYVSACSYWFYVRAYGNPSEISSETFGTDEYLRLYIDVTSGKVVDTDVCYLYTSFDHKFTFTKY